MSVEKVTIIIPVIRQEQAQICLAAVWQNAGIPDEAIDVIMETDNEGIGAPKMVKKLTDKAANDLVMFLGDDTIPKADFLKNALQAAEAFPAKQGIVGLNDLFHDGNEMATHFLGHKAMLPYLGGEFFHTGYIHMMCDLELTRRAKAAGRYVWAEDAIIEHDHPIVRGESVRGTEYEQLYNDRVILRDRALFNWRQANGWPTTNDLWRKGRRQDDTEKN